MPCCIHSKGTITMRSLPVDVSRINFIGSGKALEKAEYAELADGTRKRSGNQAKDDNGVPLWTIDVFVDDDDALRAEAIGVTVASFEPPQTEKFKPVKFRKLTATIYADRGSGQAKVSLKAEGVEGAQGGHKAQQHDGAA